MTAPPLAQVNPGPLTFKAQPQGTTSAPQTLTITNNGGQPLSINGFAFAGADPGDYFVGSNDCHAAVAPGQSCQATIRSAPKQQGASAATLQIDSNDPSSPATVNL